MLNLITGKTHDVQADAFEELLPSCIFFSRILMNWPIHFDNESGLPTIKINDEAINSMLATELKTINLPIAENLPQRIFSSCWFMSHLSRKWLQPCPKLRRGLPSTLTPAAGYLTPAAGYLAPAAGYLAPAANAAPPLRMRSGGRGERLYMRNASLPIRHPTHMELLGQLGDELRAEIGAPHARAAGFFRFIE